MNKEIVGKLVWLGGLKGMYPEKWANDMPTGGKVGKTVIVSYDLNADEFPMSLLILEQRYPLPKT